MFGGKGRWWDAWELCELCNTLYAKDVMHVCDEKAKIAQRAADFRAEWDEIRWKPFDEWMDTKKGQFAAYLAKRHVH